MLIRLDRRAGVAVEENRYRGEVVGEVAHGTSFTLHFKLVGHPVGLGRDYDLPIDLPSHVYCRLEVDSKKQRTASLRREAVPVIGRSSRQLAAEGWVGPRRVADPRLG